MSVSICKVIKKKLLQISQYLLFKIYKMKSLLVKRSFWPIETRSNIDTFVNRYIEYATTKYKSYYRSINVTQNW